MFFNRGAIETRESESLAPYATSSASSRGRDYLEDEHDYRTAFQRDRDRVIHTTAFRRLTYKTQVFVYHEGDHYRNRLTHTIEVAQIGRTIARALGANEDLTEAICLAHDLGHPAFGHTGEATLNQLMSEHGGFDHQRQTMRIITQLEDRYQTFPGLNLTYEVREGIVKHDTDYDLLDARGFEPDKRGTLECQISNLADEIAYNTADLEDGLRSGVLDPQDVRGLQAWRMVSDQLGEDDICKLDDKYRARAIRRLIGIEISDAVIATTARLVEAAPASADTLRELPYNIASFSSDIYATNVELKAFLMQHFYRHPRVMRMAYKAHHMLTSLYNAYCEEPRQLPYEVQARSQNGSDSLQRVICDYIAGMTDRFAILEHKRLFDPESRV